MRSAHRAERARDASPAELLGVTSRGLLSVPQVHQGAKQALFRAVDGGIQVLTRFAHVEIAVPWKLHERMAAITRVTLANVQLDLDPIEVVRIRMGRDRSDDPLLDIVTQGIREVEMSCSQVEVHEARFALHMPAPRTPNDSHRGSGAILQNA